MQTIPIDHLRGQCIQNYHLGRLLERGRSHALYLAHHPAYPDPVSLTLFSPPQQLSQEASQRFCHHFHTRALALLALRHPHIFPVLDAGEYAGCPFLVAPFLQVNALSELLKLQGRLDGEQTQVFLEQLAAGLDFAHRKGIVHGSLTPAHLLLKESQTLLITGFGMQDLLLPPETREHTQASEETGGILLSPPGYTAPELLAGQPPDSRSDIYALGCILFELLSGTRPCAKDGPLNSGEPFPDQPLPSLQALCPSLPSGLEAVVKKALDPLPAQRFQSAGEVAAAFAQIMRESKRCLLETETAPRIHGNSTGKWQIVPPILTGKIPVPAALSHPTSPSRSSSEQIAQHAPSSLDLPEKAGSPPIAFEVIRASSPPPSKSVSPVSLPDTDPQRKSQKLFLKLAVGTVSAASGFVMVQWIAALAHLPHLFGSLFR